MTESTRGLTAGAIEGLLADTSPYLSCDDCFTLIDVHVERSLADPGYEDPAMTAHLAGCGACQEEADALVDLLTGSPRPA